MEFVHLHVHSHYSLLDGLSKINELVERAASFGSRALALTDHGALYGAIEFYLTCKDKGIKPIIGVEAYITDDLKKPPPGTIEQAYSHITLLAKNLEGYRNLMKLTSLAYLQGWYYRPRIDRALLAEHKEGLVVLSGCLLGELPRAILSGRRQQAEEVINFYRELFGEDYYFEVQSHPHLADQAKVNQALFALAQAHRVALVATADAHYVHPEDQEAQDILLCIQTNSKLSDPNRFTMKGELFDLASPQEMERAFREHPDTLENTLAIAEKSSLEIPLGHFILPDFPTPANSSPREFLHRLLKEGLSARNLAGEEKVKERLELELSTIEKMGYESYFLIVADYVGWAKKQGIVVGPGRGSAAGSLVAYLLGITSINPLEHNLLFERFLNPERISLPDIDIDFADDRRDEVIRYIQQKYGRLNVAQISTFGTMASRAVVRDVGRALGMNYSEVDKVAKLVPPPVQGKAVPLRVALEDTPELKEMYENDLKIRRLFEIASKLEGTVRHISTHAAGVVISDQPLYYYTPIQYAPKSEERVLITQYSMGPLEKIGLIKMDLLGLKNLTTIRNTLRILRKTRAVELDIEKVPLNDPKTYQLLGRAQTIGVFQLEGEGVRRYLQELKPTNFSDISAMISLYRPGPMQLIPDFIDRKRGRKKISYIHPKLEPILKETYGIAVHQEQVLQIAREIAGFSLGEVDVLRKAIGKKIRTLLSEQKKKFIEGAIKNDIPPEVAERIFDFIEPFASYGFNRAHSVSYATISYWTAYLKANFPPEFMAALLTSDQNDLDKTAKNIAEAGALGIKVLLPSVNESFIDFAVIKAAGHIRFGLNAIKNVGRKVSELIVEEREKNGLYQSLSDWLKRLPKEAFNHKVLESLIKAGALDEFAPREQLLAALPLMVEMVAQRAPLVSEDQLAIFVYSPQGGNKKELILPKAEPISEQTKLTWEKEYLGTYVSRHPFKEIAAYLQGKVWPIHRLGESARDGQKVKVAGIITRSQKVLTKNGEPMRFVTLEDLSGSLEVIVFPRLLQENPLLWEKDKMLLVEGIINVKSLLIEEGEKLHLQPEAKIIVEKAFALTKELLNRLALTPPGLYTEQKDGFFVIHLPPGANHGELQQIKEILERYRGEIPVKITLFSGGEKRELLTPVGISPAPELTEEIQQIIEKVEVR